MTTYAPAFSFIGGNSKRGMVFNQTQIGYADYTEGGRTQFLFWHTREIEGYVFVGEDPKKLVKELTWISGRMRELPEWISKNGAIVGLQGGENAVTKNYKMLKENRVPMSAVWV